MGERNNIGRFVAVNFGLGAIIGFAFVAAMLTLDVRNLGTLIASTHGGSMAALLLLLGFVSLAFGALLSTADADPHAPQRPGRPSPVRVVSRSARR